MLWYGIVLLVCMVIGPFDALYVYIRAQRRRDALKKKREADGKKENK
ncbi:MAG: hypothetical protein IJ124_04555 [Clostridia bacterium]|nr:hypothetical protein [Clostridia bacterium]